ncbi:MAG: hypothetical protein N4Q30_00040 [Neisseriaceae bacterium]|nr:hypothetical protein [Neisseriaceae bacterium]
MLKKILLIHLIFLLASCAHDRAPQPKGSVFKINQDHYYETTIQKKKK